MNTRRRARRLSVLALAAVVVVLVLSLAAPAFGSGGAVDRQTDKVVAKTQVAVQTHAKTIAATTDTAVKRQVIVEFGDPVTIAADEQVQTVVNIGGDITVAGTVDTSVVAIGGNVTLLPTAKVGPTNADEASVVVVNGELKRSPGSEVNGGVDMVDVGNAGDLANWVNDWGRTNTFHPLGSFVGWLIMTVVFLLLGLIAAVLLPDQIRSIERHVAVRPAASLGWGALTVLLTPLALVALAITIIGLLVVIPVAIAIPFFTFFVVTAVGTYVIERLFATQLKGNLVLAVVIAVLATSIVSRIPVLGVIIIIAMVFIGTGAAVLGLAEWRRRRKLLRAAMQPGPGQPPQPPQPPYGAPPQPPYGGPQGPQGPYAPQGPYGPPQTPYGQPAAGQSPAGFVPGGPAGPAPVGDQPAMYAPQVYAQPPVPPQPYGQPQQGGGQWPPYTTQPYGPPYAAPGYWPPQPPMGQSQPPQPPMGQPQPPQPPMGQPQPLRPPMEQPQPPQAPYVPPQAGTADQPAEAVTTEQPAQAATAEQPAEAVTAEQRPEAATMEQQPDGVTAEQPPKEPDEAQPPDTLEEGPSAPKQG
jgi:hypothetical protein